MGKNQPVHPKQRRTIGKAAPPRRSSRAQAPKGRQAVTNADIAELLARQAEEAQQPLSRVSVEPHVTLFFGRWKHLSFAQRTVP